MTQPTISAEANGLNRFIVQGIVWDTDGVPNDALPTDAIVVCDTDEDQVVDVLSDHYKFCIHTVDTIERVTRDVVMQTS